MATGHTPSRRSQTPQDRQQYRKGLYKTGDVFGWRDKYRQRCVERLKANRHNVMDQHRYKGADSPDDIVDTVYDIMQEEWDNLRSEVPLPPLTLRGQKRKSHSPLLDDLASKRLFSDNEDDPNDIDAILAVMDDITQELIKEEQNIIAQYEEEELFTEKVITAAIDCLTNDDIICPLCLKNILCQDSNVIYCTCGLSIDTAQDGITLDFVKEQLENASSQHSQSCVMPPSFSLKSIAGMTNLVMSCQGCEFLYIIV